MRRSSTLVFVMLVVVSSGVFAQRANVVVSIDQPADDDSRVSAEADVSGIARIPSGQHLWLLVHRVKGYERYWWPQGEAMIDPISGRWGVHTVFGEPQDVGFDFEIAVVTIASDQHSKLQAYLDNAMIKRSWTPIPMPSTTSAPVIRRVRRAT